MLGTFVLSLFVTHAAAAPASCNANPEETATQQLNIRYQPELGENSQRLDIYAPKSAKKPYKTIMLIHGGCFQGGGRATDDSKDHIDRLVAAGYAAVSVDYRLAHPDLKDPSNSKDIYPASLDDVRDAFCYVQTHGAEYGLDSAKIATMGYSAGGTLATYLGVRHTAGSAHQSSCTPKPAGVVDLFGRMDFLQATEPDPSKWDCGEGFAGLQRTEDRPEDIFRKMDVLSHIDVNKVSRVLAIHGTKDVSVSYKNSEELCDTMKPKCELKTIKGADHMFRGKGEMDEAYDSICTFLSHEVFGNGEAQVAARKRPTAAPRKLSRENGVSR